MRLTGLFERSRPIISGEYFLLHETGGVWGVGGSPAYTEAPTWLGRSFVSPEAGLRSLILSYLEAFGPASVKDMQI
jgi:hypothetical protein